MQLKLKRSSKETGIFSKTTEYHLDAMLHLTDEEIEKFKKYNQWKATIIPSKRMIDAINRDDEYNQQVLTVHTFESLTKGLGFADKDINLIERVEHFITAGVSTVKKYIESMESFDGTTDTEVVIDFGDDDPKIVSRD